MTLARDSRWHLTWCALLASFAVAALALGGCGSSEPKRSEENVAGPIREMREFTLVETHEGVRRVVLVGSHMTEQPDRHSVEVDSVKADFYDEEGEHQSVLTARSGTVQTETGDMVVRGDVVVVTDDGIRLETDELRWLNEKRRIVTDLPVRILREGGEVTGIGLETDPELREFRLGEQIEGEWEKRQ
jgi:LPS export ABC transporter protein LptC